MASEKEYHTYTLSVRAHWTRRERERRQEKREKEEKEKKRMCVCA